MFTGLVEGKGALVARRSVPAGVVLRVLWDPPRRPIGAEEGGPGYLRGPLVLGESIAVDGACLTVARVTEDGFEADASVETLERTTLGDLPLGAPVNLERSVELGARLGGHLVTGHVDGTVTLVLRRTFGEACAMQFAVASKLARFIAEKGSVAVNGISLTVNGVTDSPSSSTFDVVIVPHTLKVTSLGELRVSAKANLEVDLLARYVARLEETRALAAEGPGVASANAAWAERLRNAGYL
jgi:riboflavin synthase